MGHENKTSTFVDKTPRNAGFALAMTLVVVAIAFALAAVGIAMATHSSAKAPNATRHATANQAAPAFMHEASVSVRNTVSDLQEGAGQTGSTANAGSSSPAGADAADDAADQGERDSSTSPDDDGADSADGSSSSSTDASESSSASSSSNPDGTAEPAAEEAETTLEKTIQTADGRHFTVRVEYAADAEVPEGAELSVVQVLKVPEGYDKRKQEFKDRPYDTEVFITEKQLKDCQQKLAEAIDVRDDDHVFCSAFLDIAIKADGQDVKPAAPVKVTIESDAMSAAVSDELWLSFFDDVKPGAEHADPLATENRSGDGKDDKEYEKGIKLTFEADEFFELGIMGVAAPLATWQDAGFEFTVYGPDSTSTWRETAYADGLPEGAELVEALSFGVYPNPDYGTQLFVGAKALGDDGAQDGADAVACFAVEGGVTGERLTDDAAAEPAAVKAGDVLAIATVAAADEQDAQPQEPDDQAAADPADGEEAEATADGQAADAPATLNGSAAFLAAGGSGTSNLSMISAIRNARLRQLAPMDAGDGDGDGDGPGLTKQYTITWKNHDGTILASELADEGSAMPVYSGETPTREADAQYTYTFSGWTPEPEAGATVTEDATFTATYTQSVRTYTITWKNDDGSVLQSGDVEYGQMPAYAGSTPTKAEEAGATYSFTHWDPTPAVVTGEATYTAQFSAAAVVLNVQDFRKDDYGQNKPIEGAKFTLTNASGVQVWSGVTSSSGVLGISRLDAGTAEREDVGGAAFAPGSTYTLRQEETGEGYFLPRGYWTIAFDDSGEFACTAHGASDDDMSTMQPDKSGIRVYLTNRPASFITYKYHYPSDVTDPQPDDIREALDFLSYRGEYVVDVADPAAGQYEFAGWQVDTFSTLVKYNQKAWLDTLSVQEHTMTAQWRKPLNVRAVTYENGDPDAAVEVSPSQPFAVGDEKSRTFDGMSGFSVAYGEQNQAVWDLNGNDAYTFAFADIKREGQDAKTVAAIQYNANVHSWQYATSSGGVWNDVGFGDVLTLYYTSEVVNLRWVQEQDDGTFRELSSERFPDKTAVVSSTWTSTNALVPDAEKPIVDGTSYYRYLGFGPSDAASSADLSKGDLQSFELRNSTDGYRFRTNNGNGELLRGSNTVYVVYSETPPDDSVYLEVGNYAQYSYDLGNLFVGATSGSNYDWIASGKTIITGEGELQVMDDDSKVLGPGREVRLVLVGAGAKSFVINGGFTGNVADGTMVSMAVESSGRVTRTTVVKDASHPTALSSTKDVTKGTLEAAPAEVSVTFDTDLFDLTVNKEWDEGSFPSNYSVDVTLQEGEEGGKPCVITNRSGSAVYTLTANGGWSQVVQNLPARCTYSVVENQIRDRNNGNKDITEDFVATYSDLEDGAITVSNVRSNDVCQVGDVKFKSVKAAVDYIGENGKTGTIQMIDDYTVPENAAVVIPADYDVTLTTAPGSSAHKIMRGFTSATDLFLVEGKLTLADVTISGRMTNGSVMTKDGDGGLITVGSDEAAGATLTVGGGARLEYGRATNGSAIYAANGAQVNLSGCTIANNRAISGGAVGVADGSCRINLSGSTFVYDNRIGDGNTNTQRNIYLNQDSDEVIHLVGDGLADGDSTKIGVYVPDGDAKAIWNARGLPAKPFATVDPGTSFANLDKLLNDRMSGKSKEGHASDLLSDKVVWGPTFSFTVQVQWLNQYFETTGVPDGAEVTLKLGGGSQVTAEGAVSEATLAKDDANNWQFEFKGLAMYDNAGDLYEYHVSEAIKGPDTFKQVVFTNDRGVKVDGVYDSPLTYENKGIDRIPVIISNYEKYTTFDLAKAWGSAQNNATSNFQLYRVPKTGANLDNGSIRYAGVGGVHDLPLGLRDGVFSTAGGNRWYVSVDGQPVQFHRFYDSAFGEFTANGNSYALVNGDAWQKGDVVSPAGGTCKVYTGSGWHDLGVSASAAQLKSFNRQDGDMGVEGAGGESVSGGAVAISGEGSITKDRLSSDYYYYAVETSVAEAGKSTAKDSHEIVALYNPEYSYDMPGQSQTVKNTRQDFLSIEKIWSEDAVNMGKCEFKVYKLADKSGTTAAYLADAKNLKALAEMKPADIQKAEAEGAIELIDEFILPVQDGAAKGSWVYTANAEGKQAPTYEDGVYFIWEVSANSVQIVAPGVDEKNVAADVVYKYDEGVNQITAHNMSDVLCKVVDDDGTENPFRTLNAALAYGRTRDSAKGSNAEFTIQMLRDYSIPESDIMRIAANERITLTTASTTEGTFRYTNNDDPGATRATITRKSGNALPCVIVNGVAGNSDLTSFTLENIAFDGANTAPNRRVGNVTYSNGSIVYAENASVVLQKGGSPEAGVQVNNARASNGGAIYAMTSHVTVDGAVFQNCTSTDTNGSLDRGGGAIWSSGDTRVTITDSTFENCSANRGGGAVQARNSGDLVISGSTFTDCVSNSYDAGAVCTNSTGTVTVSDCAFTDCGAKHYGGAVAAVNAACQEMTVTGSAFTGCQTINGGNEAFGGGVYCAGLKLVVGGEAEGDACTFTGCVGGTRGGAVCHNNSAAETTVRNCAFTECRVPAGGDGDTKNGGGGVEVISDKFTLAGCTFTDCSSNSRGGAVSHYNLTSLESTIENCTFERCATVNSGGGAIENAAKVQTTRYCTFTDCKAPKSAGGAIDIGHFNEDKTATVEYCTFTGCLAGGGNGGGGISTGGETLTVTGCTFESCTAVAPEGSNAMLYGGGISMGVGGNMNELNLYGCSFTNCTAGIERGSGHGGAVYSKSTVLRVLDNPATGEHTTFDNCQARGSGGAICQTDRNVEDITLVVENASFADCAGINGHGGAIRTYAETATLTNSTFDNCTCKNNGGAVSQDIYDNYRAGSALTVNDCTFAQCRAGVNGTGGETRGGAIYTDIEAFTLTGVAEKKTFDDCSAYGAGGAICHNRGDMETASDVITDASFQKCASTNSSGGGVNTNVPVVRMTRVSFQDGSCMWSGGALNQAPNNSYVEFSETTLAACTFENLEAGVNSSNNNAYGGAVYTTAKTLTVSPIDGEQGVAKFENCKAKGTGGAIYHDRNYETAMTDIDDCSFVDCTSTRSTGGAISSNVPVLTLDNSEIERCRSYWSGGAIYHSPADTYLAVSRTNVMGASFKDTQAGYGNTESNTGAYGGAIYAYALATVIGSEETPVTFEDSVARGAGGAVYQGRNWQDTEFTLSHVRFDSTTAQNSVGGAVGAYATLFTASDVSVAHSSAKNSGGAIYHEVNGNNETRLARGTTHLSHVVVADSTTTNEHGGGLYTNARTLVIDAVGGDSSFTDCTARKTGGAVRHSNNHVNAVSTISATDFANCTSETDDGGGGVWTQATKLALSSCDFSNCTAFGNGGGLYHRSDGGGQASSCQADIKDCSFTNCETTSQWGGGVRTIALVTTVSSTSFEDCTARYGGGGMFQSRNTEGSTFTVEDCSFANCRATYADADDRGGGAINVVARAIDISGTEFTGCSAKNRGGALYHGNAGAAATAKLADCSFSYNTVSERNGHGGAIYFLMSDAALTDTAITGCAATASGGAIYQNGTSSRPLLLDHCEITGNKATTSGGGVFFNSNNTFTLSHGTSITGNTLESTDVANGAGVYMNQQALGRLVLGATGLDSDRITVYDNKTGAGAQSNVRLVQGSYDNKSKRYLNRNSETDLYANSVVLLSNLTKDGYGVDGTIGVCNPGPEKTRFGKADVSDRTGVEYIVSDIDSMRGKIDPVDLNHQMLIWYAPPVCKITDANGTTLAYGGSNTAVFTTLEEAFEVVNVLTPGYLKNGDGVTPSQIQIQMLVPEYKTTASLPTLRRSITITTSDAGDDEFHYPRNATSRTAMVKRGDAVDGSLITVGGNVGLTVARLTIDGGSTDTGTREVAADGGLIYGQGGATVVLSAGSVLQNSAVGDSNSGGAVFITGTSDSSKRSLVMERGAVIKDCSAGNGGGVFLTGGVFFDMRDDSRIESCSASQAGGAVYVSPYATMGFDADSALPNAIPVIVGNRITDRSGKGAGIYLVSNDSKLRLQLGARAQIADNLVLGTEDSARQNGFDDYPLLRQDIYLAESREPATSITLVGDMSQPAGSLWVWAEYENHYKSEMQFAVIESDASGNPTFTPREQTLGVFRNAQDDVTTENTSGSYIYGIQGDGVDVIWSYEEGASHVILKKVGDTGAGYDALEGAVFTVYKGRSARPYVVRHDDGTRETLSGLVSGSNGVFWVGKLPYGTYYLEETTVPSGYSQATKWFRLDINEDDVTMSPGYATRGDAG